MSIVTALFALGIAAASLGALVASISLMAMFAPFEDADEDKGARFFKLSVLTICVGAFIIGLTAQGATS